ncbi:MAG: hypothetical protein MZU91_11095 [Desulfosudis oleivorans]|nr:hypothetical protein [Desulfosudis oleivorans]
MEKAIKRRVLDAGVPEANIGLDDHTVRTNPLFVKATALINVRPVRTHYLAGMSGCLKNYIMFAESQPDHHPDSCASLGSLFLLPQVKGQDPAERPLRPDPAVPRPGPAQFQPPLRLELQGPHRRRGPGGRRLGRTPADHGQAADGAGAGPGDPAGPQAHRPRRYEVRDRHGRPRQDRARQAGLARRRADLIARAEVGHVHHEIPRMGPFGPGPVLDLRPGPRRPAGRPVGLPRLDALDESPRRRGPGHAGLLRLPGRPADPGPHGSQEARKRSPSFTSAEASPSPWRGTSHWSPRPTRGWPSSMSPTRRPPS